MPLRASPTMQFSKHLLLWTMVTLILLAVFFLYTRPDFLVQLANQVWSCF
jgi:hypothetical protein